MSSLWRTKGGGKWEIEQYSGRPGTTIKRFVSLLLYFWGGIRDYDDDCADIEIRQFCGCQPASIWLNGFYITKLLQLLPSATNTHPDFLQENGKIQHHIREGVNGKKTFSFGLCPNSPPPPPWPQFGQIGPLFSEVKIQDLKVSLELWILYILYNILYICNLKNS